MPAEVGGGGAKGQKVFDAFLGHVFADGSMSRDLVCSQFEHFGEDKNGGLIFFFGKIDQIVDGKFSGGGIGIVDVVDDGGAREMVDDIHAMEWELGIGQTLSDIFFVDAENFGRSGGQSPVKTEVIT